MRWSWSNSFKTSSGPEQSLSGSDASVVTAVGLWVFLVQIQVQSQSGWGGTDQISHEQVL